MNNEFIILNNTVRYFIMVKIRLCRKGKKKMPFYFIVVTDVRKKRDSNYIEKIGYFCPSLKKKPVLIYINKKKIKFWINKGAKLSNKIIYLIKKIKKNDY